MAQDCRLQSAAYFLNIPPYLVIHSFCLSKILWRKRWENEVAAFLGELISFRNSLKLIHWSITGKGSYEAHISLDQAIDSLVDITDRLTETSFALNGSLDIVIPETSRPKGHYIKHIEDFYKLIEDKRKELFLESFSQSIIDDAQEAVQQLLFRLKRLE